MSGGRRKQDFEKQEEEERHGEEQPKKEGAVAGANEKKEQGVDTGSGKVAKSTTNRKNKKKKVATGVSTSASARVLRPRSGQLKKTKTGDAPEKTLPRPASKSDSGINTSGERTVLYTASVRYICIVHVLYCVCSCLK